MSATQQGKNNVVAPVGSAAACTPSDATVLSPPTRGLWIGTAGDVVVTCENDTVATTFKNVPSGFLLPVRCVKVNAATTAADIVLLR